MTSPRLVIDLDKICDNARSLVARLAPKGIGVTGVTKAALGSPAVAHAMLRGGVDSLGDSRLQNIENLRHAKVNTTTMLIRSPLLSQVDGVVALVDTSFNSEAEVIAALAASASRQNTRHAVVLMVELGDLREGVPAADVVALAGTTLRHPNLVLAGLGTNLACRSGVVPDRTNMAELTRLVELVERSCGVTLAVVSGGNSANLDWALSGADTGRVNNLRLGEAILLGREPLHRRPLTGLHTDAVTLVAEVIESQVKPAQPWGETAEAAFGRQSARCGGGNINQSLLAIGRQDVDPAGLTPPADRHILGASSDHLVVDTGADRCAIGSEIHFELNYSALLRAMTSPFVARVFSGAR